MARYRTHGVAHILQVVQAYPAGETRPRLTLLGSESMLILVAMLLPSRLGSASSLCGISSHQAENNAQSTDGSLGDSVPFFTRILGAYRVKTLARAKSCLRQAPVKLTHNSTLHPKFLRPRHCRLLQNNEIVTPSD
ncbi:hypothetical protein OFEAOIEE_LOCUS3091 [Methylorubrum extorquens]